jgi:hypothetical protein
MPGFDIGIPTRGMTVDQLVELVAKNFRQLIYLLGNLDSMNVRRLNTNITSIQSANGQTVINGPLLEMYDQQTPPVLRLLMGYDSKLSTPDFTFQMYNKSGALTAQLDSAGAVLFTGSIQTGVTGGGNPYLVLTGGSLSGYDAGGNLSGLCLTPASGGYDDVTFYHTGTPLLQFSDQTTEFILEPMAGSTGMGLGGSAGPTNCYGAWNFNGATSISGLVTTVNGTPAHSHTVIT